MISSLEEDGVDINIDEKSIYYLSNVDAEETSKTTQNEIISTVNKSISLMSSTYDFSEPAYDFEMLSAFLLEAAKDFSKQYSSLLDQQHWQTIKGNFSKSGGNIHKKHFRSKSTLSPDKRTRE